MGYIKEILYNSEPKHFITDTISSGLDAVKSDISETESKLDKIEKRFKSSKWKGKAKYGRRQRFY